MLSKFVQALKRALLRFWALRWCLALACILIAVVLGTYHYVSTSQLAGAEMTLNYSEASLGLNPNRTRFNINELVCDDVLDNTIRSAGLTGQLTRGELREAISISPIDVTNVSSSATYINTSYSISLNLKNSFAHLSTTTLLQILCGCYKDYFMEHYGENQSVFSAAMPSYFNSEPYLRLKSLTLRAEQLNRYLNSRVTENNTYTDPYTGVGFLSLSKEIQNVISYEVPRIQSYILRSSLSADASSLTSMLRCKLQMEQLDYTTQMAYYDSDNAGIALYDKTMSAIVMIPTLDADSQFYMSRTKTALDSMASSANGSLTEATSHQDVITSTQYVLGQMSITASAQALSDVNAMLDTLSGTLDAIQHSLRTTDASYIIYKTQNYLMFNDGIASFSQRAGIKKIVAVLAGFLVLSFGVCLIDLLRKERKEEAEKRYAAL